MKHSKVASQMLETPAHATTKGLTGGRYPAWLAELMMLIKGRENEHVSVGEGIGVGKLMDLKIPTNRGTIKFRINRDTQCDAINEFVQRVIAGEKPEVVRSKKGKEKLGLAGKAITCLQIYVEED